MYCNQFEYIENKKKILFYLFLAFSVQFVPLYGAKLEAKFVISVTPTKIKDLEINELIFV